MKNLANKTGIICLIETCEHGSMDQILYIIPEFNIPITNDGFNRNGGVTVHVHSIMNYSCINPNREEDELCNIEINPGTNMFSCHVYTIHHLLIKTHFSLLSQFLPSFTTVNNLRFILGDMNIELLIDNSMK